MQIKQLEEEEEKDESVEDVDIWLENLLNQIEDHLPDRSLRLRKKEEKRKQQLTEFTDSKRGVIVAIKQQVDALKAPSSKLYRANAPGIGSRPKLEKCSTSFTC